MVKIKVTTLTRLCSFTLNMKVPFFKKKNLEPQYRFWKIRKYEFCNIKSG